MHAEHVPVEKGPAVPVSEASYFRAASSYRTRGVRAHIRVVSTWGNVLHCMEPAQVPESGMELKRA